MACGLKPGFAPGFTVLAESGLLYERGVSAAPLPRLAEPPPEPLNESELSWIWAGQRFPPEALRTPDGRALRVLNPGRRGGAAGPDFLDAVFVLDGRQRRGDVELHVRASSFRGHGHDTDPAYDGVALHVVFRADDGIETALNGGGRAPVAEFAPWLVGRTEELQHWLASQALWREPCRDAAARLGEAGVREVLRAGGEQRFAARSAALEGAVAAHGESEALWRALFDVIGVGGDRAGFRRLAQAFPARLARRLGEGLPPAGEGPLLAAALSYAAGLAPLPSDAPCPLPPPIRPALAGAGRPANRPRSRLAGLAALFVRAGGDLASYARASVARCETPAQLTAAWQASLEGRALLGAGRAREVVLNVVLPYTAARPELRAASMRLLDALPASPPYGKTRFLEANLAEANLTAGGGRRLVRGALEQQGLLSLLGEWCSRGGCGRCPLS